VSTAPSMEKLSSSKNYLAKKAASTRNITGVTAAYQKARATGSFPHTSESGVPAKILQLQILRGTLQGHNRVHGMYKRLQDLIVEETKLAESFKIQAAITNAAKQSENSETFKSFSDVHHTITEARKKLVVVYQQVEAEWKQIEKVDIPRLTELEELCNKTLIEYEFYKAHDQKELEAAKTKYEDASSNFVSEVEEFENKMEFQYEEWMTTIGIAERDFYKISFDVYNDREMVLKKQVDDCKQQ